MIYNDFKGKKLSALGLGCMRFPKNSDNDADINVDAVREMINYALDSGINYFDTAYRYHSGESEPLIGKLLAEHPRDRYYIATKYPGYDADKMSRAPEIFQEQLDRCCVEYFDFYLCHNVCENNVDMYLDPSYGVMEYLIAQKREGKILHLGFSTHGSRDVIRRFLDAYGDELEFCQLQLNYLDWEMQNAKEKVKLVESYGIPVWVMEPVRGGRLAVLSEEHQKKLEALRPGVSAPEWAFRFLQGLSSVKMILSGMSNMEQLQQNIQTFSEIDLLNDLENRALMEIADDMIRSKGVPCTGCSYCTEHCPQQLNIPELMKAANGTAAPGKMDCIGCRSCESYCPQGIRISEVIAAMAKLH